MLICAVKFIVLVDVVYLVSNSFCFHARFLPNMTSYPALRIAQLDSEMLDSEFLEITTNLLDHNLGELSDSIKWWVIFT